MIAKLLIQANEVQNKTLLVVVLTIFVLVIFYYSLKALETIYIIRNKKPLFVHFYIIKKRLPSNQKSILKGFTFYNRLQPIEQRYFEHRVASFINDKDYIGRKEIEITDEMRVLTAATAVMLTFGFRDYFIGLIDKIIIFPKEFYSNFNQDYHKGEFNPKLKALVLSWEHFKLGYAIENDKLNVGIHEFTHAIHLNSLKERDISSNIFQDSYKELVELLSSNEQLRDDLIKSKYFRSYAYTNQYEFIAVIIESFIESPTELRSSFPHIYAKVKQMLNFNFKGY